jgi:hypothetical protein
MHRLSRLYVLDSTLRVSQHIGDQLLHLVVCGRLYGGDFLRSALGPEKVSSESHLLGAYFNVAFDQLPRLIRGGSVSGKGP